MASKKGDSKSKKRIPERQKDDRKKMKRRTSKNYILKIRERDRTRKARQRLNSKTPREQPLSDRVTARRKEGVRRRRACVTQLRRRIEQLIKLSYVHRIQVKRLERCQLLKQKQKIEHLTNLLKSNNKIPSNSSVTDTDETMNTDGNVTKNITVKGLFMNNVSPNAKQRAKARIIEQKDLLPRGLNRNLRAELGLNISNRIHVSNDEPLSPDIKKMINGIPIRFRLHNLNVLHEQFQAETGATISYSTFSNYVPIHLDTDLSYILNDDTKTNNLKTKLNDLRKQQENISYIEWQKEKLPNHSAPVSKKTYCTSSLNDFVGNFLCEIDILGEHVQRIKAQFSAFKQARLDALNTDDID
ncbi:unnamed protein product [Didymodactylos carnosus]|uniref:Uncharacterized protein n=1 Tax=Didymodactylos carnosus TaxID=1234261 RepID=A0A8S2ULA3_9BILA|nr:unnamed protein product [Didymodactylos carnosus]CAF4343214.1 unnamed protein product [Didymodactylos carnosus]